MKDGPPAEPPRRTQLERWFRAGLEAVSPERVLERALVGEGDHLEIGGDRLPDGSSLVVLAVGKAACPMARALERRAAGRLRRGLAITKDGHASAVEGFEVREAAHPVPDARSARAARDALAFAAGVASDETLVVLLSGGASSLTSLPVEGISMEALARTNRWLLASGADIAELNCVRKHLGAFGGGRLALASPAARIDLLVISDVPGDRLDVIGSGPCAADPSSWRDALDVVRRYEGEQALPEEVVRTLERGAGGGFPETPSPGDARLDRVRAHVVASNTDARSAVCAAAAADGWSVVDAGASLAGEARDVGAQFVSLSRGALAGAARGVCVAGGETTVTLRGAGLGGRCQELALAAAAAERGRADWTLLAAGTDGGDGPTDVAGAHADGGTCQRAARAGRDAEGALRENDSHRFFAAEGGLFRTGPTPTNVMDLVLAGVVAGQAS